MSDYLHEFHERPNRDPLTIAPGVVALSRLGRPVVARPVFAAVGDQSIGCRGNERELIFWVPEISNGRRPAAASIPCKDPVADLAGARYAVDGFQLGSSMAGPMADGRWQPLWTGTIGRPGGSRGAG